ncbi:heterokaryon incompatibility protein-domain-containing protein [Hygrophoropsis aurantiaca]|uniref:Heterokaryon incompatibility protein-domain-containing protein n=1 Tax=Hygrophoropsis aurantiaca TaxID=72124 RepID=A0ACB8ATD8_9AGAM|nr:heterokaryon incompatibility protein-domain-containing protein [Hygrophoropsis aurantiaca]
MPLRLIDTHDGRCYTNAEIVDILWQSNQWRALLQEEQLPENPIQYAEEAVQSSLAYVMLSHRWGKDEPTYQDVKDQSVYEMDAISPGATKLQRFCHAAADRGFRWAWSDTCCIDKSSSSELQESINSMFVWYRNSGLTIIYLADVEVFSHGNLLRSDWFKRGWTLQEVLAPRTVQFFKNDWSLLLGTVGDAKLNHKENKELMEILEDVTGIDVQSLTYFKPGVESVRERLRWASGRITTKVEDTAYALLGIFDINLPILYGEKEKAYTRLQEEIMKNTDDVSLFDWVGQPSKINSCLASRPACFAGSPWIPPAAKNEGLSAVVGLVTGIVDGLTADVLHTITTLLKDPPLGHFIANGRMNMRFFVYPVLSIAKVNPKRSSTMFQYTLQAGGLKSLVVETAQKLETTTGLLSPSVFCLARLWDNALLSSPKSNSDDHNSDKNPSDAMNLWDPNHEGMVARFAHWIQQPFIVQLMMAYPGGPFRRIQTEERIIAHPQDILLNFRAPRTLIVH